MTGITAHAYELAGILEESYQLEFYQRDYRWTEENIHELLDDLLTDFRECYCRGHKLKDVRNYGEFYLGAIVTTTRQEGVRELIDGQQRLTTLILLLIYLAKRLEAEQFSDQARQVWHAVYRWQGGESVYKLRAQNSRADHHKTAFDHVRYENGEGNRPLRSESEQNIIDRYLDIKRFWGEDENEMDIHETNLFAEWLLLRVIVVRIVAESGEDGYNIFETMNDRGLELRPGEMLRGFLLDRLPDEERKDQRYLWDESIRKPREWPASPKRDYAEECLRTWIRARYSRSEDDYKKIGNSVHHWFRRELERNQRLSVQEIKDLTDLDIPFFSNQYHEIWRSSRKYDHKQPHGYFNGSLDLTSLQAALVLAGLDRALDRDKDRIEKRVQVITRFPEIFVARRIWAGQTVAHRTMVSHVARWIPEVRKAGRNLGAVLCGLLDEGREEQEPFAGICRMTSGTRPKIKALLARLTEYVEEAAGRSTAQYADLMIRGKKGFDIEHLIPDQPEGHLDRLQAKNIAEFQDTRNRIGGLVLLPLSKNRTLKARDYEVRRMSYRDENKLAASLLETVGMEDAAMKRVREKFGLQPESQLDLGLVDRREEAYRNVAKDMWNSERLIEME